MEKLYIPSIDEVLASSDIKVVEPPTRWTPTAAEFVLDLSGYDLKYRSLPPQERARRGVYERHIENAHIFGGHHLHSFISNRQRFDCQDIKGYQIRLKHHLPPYNPNRPCPIIKRDDDYYFSVLESAPGGSFHLDGRVTFGSPTEPENWGMWLLQAVQIAAKFIERGNGGRLLVNHSKEWQSGLLRTLGLSSDRLVNYKLLHTYSCDELLFDQYSSIDLAVTPSEAEAYGRLRRNLIGPRSHPKRRIFLSRLSISTLTSGYRALQNEVELIEAMSAIGFDIIEPEQFSFVDQVRIFSEAEVVVGLGGAALFNTVFCQPGTRVISIESTASFVHNHALLLSSLGHKYGIIFGREDRDDPRPSHRRWSIDVADTIAAIKQI